MVRNFTMWLLMLVAGRMMAQYCPSYATTPNDQDIYNVTFGSLNNSSDCVTPAPGPGSVSKSYGNYTTLPATAVAAGAVVPFSITVGDCENANFWHSKVAIFVDLNQDADFLDTGEKLYEMPSVIVGPYVTTGTVTIPATATSGLTRMRVLCVETYSAITPCMVYGWGETEDYMLDINGGTSGPSPCSGVPIAGNTLTSGNNMCLGTAVSLSLQYPNSEYTGIGYQWQTSANGSTYTDIAGANAATYSAAPSGATYLRCKLTCSASGYYGFSIPAHIVPEAQGPVITCPAAVSATASGGTCAATLTPLQLGTATATDNCPGILTVGSNFNAQPFAIGTSVVVWTASDAVGNTATCSQTITVVATATEICNNLDDDCDGQTDEGTTTTFYADADGDAFGVPFISLQACTTAPEGYVGNSSDCDDNNADIHPGATETCDEADNDCDNTTDEGVKTTFYIDGDSDGHGAENITVEACAAPSGYAVTADDCNDTNETIFTGADEICDDLDNDCNDLVDDGLMIPFYYDQDNDGQGTPAVFVEDCAPSEGFVGNNADCDDSNPSIYAFAAEVCDNIDNDCDLEIDEELAAGFIYFVDADNDGYGASGTGEASCSPTAPQGLSDVCGDCNDADVNIFPGAPEVTANTDNNCNGIVDDNCHNVGLAEVKTVMQSATKVLVYWADINDATVYNLQYRSVGSSSYTTIPSINNSFVNVENLSPTLDYELRIRTKCIDAFTPYSTNKLFKVKQTPGICAKPVLGTAIVINNQAVRIWWNYANGASKYSIRYRPSNSSNWTNKTATQPNTLLNYLLPGQTYIYQVRAYCSSGWTSYSSIGTFSLPTAAEDCNSQGLTAQFTEETHTESTDASRGETLGTAVARIQTQPNPSDGRFGIIVQGFNEEEAEILICDLYGAVHYRKEEKFITNQTLTQQVSLPSLPAGIYLIRVEGSQMQLTQKVVIVK